MEEKTRKVLFHLINTKTKGVDIYHHNGSMWLIFTDQKKWVIELSKDGTLWYNHYFFKDCFKYLSLDVVENQHYITEWVESIIQNGGIYTTEFRLLIYTPVEDVIQNGVRNTDSWVGKPFVSAEYIIQNGIKETIDQWNQNRPSVKDVIEKGVKETTPSGYLGSIEMKGKIVHQFESPKQNNEVEDIIQNGVKETNPHYIMGDLTIEEVIQNGVKETKKIEHDRTTYHGYFNQERGSHTPLDTVQNVIENGIKETNWRTVDNFPEFEERVIQNGIKETWGYERQPQTRVNDVIQTGKKFDTQ
jgi:hypothetical protein